MAKNGYKILDSDMHVFRAPRSVSQVYESQVGRARPARPAEDKARPDKVYSCGRPAAAFLRHASTRRDDNLVVSTDYPHMDSHWPNAMEHFFEIEVPDSARRRNLWDNCARLYGVTES